MSFLYAGWDKHHGFQLYHSDPSGNYSGWKANAIGNNHAQAESVLKTDYKEDMNVEACLKLAVSVLGTMNYSLFFVLFMFFLFILSPVFFYFSFIFPFFALFFFLSLTLSPSSKICISFFLS